MKLRLAAHRTRFRQFDIVLLVATAAVVLPAPLSVRDAAWVTHLEPLPALAIGGLLVGYLLERTRVSGAVGHLLGVLVGLEVIAYRYAGLAAEGSLSERVEWLAGRVGGWLETVATGGVSNDAVVFALAMAALAWLLGQISAWLMFRDGAPWLVLALNGLALLMNLSYASTSLGSYLAWFLFASVLLLAAHQVARRQELWRRAEYRVDPRVGLRLLAGTAVAAAALLSLAWAMPSNLTNPAVAGTWNRATSPWQSLEREFDRWFASLRAGDRTARGLNFGRTLAPRGAFDLGDTPVLLVRSTERLYLRATTADRYAGQAMTGTETRSVTVPGSTDVINLLDIPRGRDIVQATVRVLASRTAIAFSPEMPLRFSVPIEVDVRGSMADIAAVRVDTPIPQNQEYTFVAAMSSATAHDLRGASEEYPGWVEERYLQLPRRMPRRVADTAANAVGSASTAYDKSIAIERFLRSSFTYSTHVPEVPPDRDWVDYFLVDSRQGYCDYFATAMVVMLRTQGVPARVASGFAPGDADLAAGTTLVRENHAHSWVEVYFPSYGWVTFEPSAIRSVPQRGEAPAAPSSEAQTTPSTPRPQLTQEEMQELQALTSPPTPSPSTPPFFTTWPGALLLLGLVLLALTGAALGGLSIAWQRGMGRLAIYQRPYAQLLRLSDWFGLVDRAPARTPYEVADTMAREVPSAAPAIQELAEAYVEGTYAKRTPPNDPWPAWTRVRRGVVRLLAGRRLRDVFRRRA